MPSTVSLPKVGNNSFLQWIGAAVAPDLVSRRHTQPDEPLATRSERKDVPRVLMGGASGLTNLNGTGLNRASILLRAGVG